eukprot:NODE_6145_length_468_cov_41.885442_g4646_i0.p2 GENE.NODE_6145_length_468_cov_41.885442_g4646_i0~~NODE_6145_length_468_cov_41.885442_g4646_i0.p2  ORF type:complete len:75 (+),score=4.61 NODE_6145_length_468_cov_41.885442_g4646_i0:79-303(+)
MTGGSLIEVGKKKKKEEREKEDEIERNKKYCTLLTYSQKKKRQIGRESFPLSAQSLAGQNAVFGGGAWPGRVDG